MPCPPPGARSIGIFSCEVHGAVGLGLGCEDKDGQLGVCIGSSVGTPSWGAELWEGYCHSELVGKEISSSV